MKEHKCEMVDTVCDFNCDKCGHNPAEIERRKKLLRQNGLTKDKNGLERLIIKKG